MGVALELVNFDDLFHRKTSHAPIVINDFSEATEEDKNNFNRLIYTKYTTDLLSNLPSCECGEVVGEYNVGVVCQNCHTPVQSPFEQDLEPLVWMRAPEGILALINPVVWTMLSEKFTRGNFEIIRWICDTTYKPPLRTPAVMNTVFELGIQRGYNNFVEHFDQILDALFRIPEFRHDSSGGTEDPLRLLLHTQRNCVFSRYLPLPNRSLLVIEETNVGTYRDPVVDGAVDAIRTMVSIDSPLSSYSVRVKENRTIKTIAQLAGFYDEIARMTLAKKEGIFRKHVFGTRSHFSFRGVISSLTDQHYYAEIHIPWGIGVSLFSIHITSKLLRRGFTPNTAKAFLYEHAQKYHPLLDELFKELIDEVPAPYVGIPVVFQRNPSLERGSAQAMYITKVKTDVNIPTISLSILSVVGFNADFDGKLTRLPSLNFSNCWKPLELN